ncbi:MAG: sigma-70 family RNA polymerase sigma factor [Paludisphaera borealis]|uniref:RNA polymerase sigma factor n=1 Tax=Paludisphaera borealis TaxID=1387353 RepID=UPI00283B0275|nr:sigma-70 family RNA polymerase sigma factor [Paludisphaera borealis]MDR3620308.1 sigma-70 family RNA polymerase sigma factor [Paludisphaera borealis]
MPTTAPLTVAETLSDEALLRRFAERREPEAFTTLAERHAGLVFGTCLRITADRHDAEELTQDCFLQLARKASTVRSSVAGWLHQIATHRALNAVRSRGRRRANEARAAMARGPESEPVEASWREVEPLLDEAVDALPDGVRDAIILHFLKSLPQSEVADRLGVHQSTVSRRVGEGLKLLHDRLQASGVVFSATPLAVLLAAHAARPEAPDLAASLGKIALLGAGSGAAGKAVAWLGVSLSQLKAWGLLAAAAIVPILVQLIVGGWYGFPVLMLMLAYIDWRRPAWAESIALSPRGGVSDNPYHIFKRWTWTAPPQNWRGALASSLAGAAIFSVLAWALVQGPTPMPGLSPFFVITALFQLSVAVRIGVRVHRHGKARGREDETADVASVPDLACVIQSAASATVGVLATAVIAFLAIRTQWPLKAALGVLLTVATTTVWGIVDAARNYLRYRRLAPTPPHEGEARPQSAKGGLVFMMFTGVLFTANALIEALQIAPVSPDYAKTAERLVRHAATVGLLPSAALLFLTFTIRPLAQLRGTTRPALWLFAVAVAVLCGVLDLGLCIAWLMPRD